MENTTYDQVHAEAMADYDRDDAYGDHDYEAARDEARRARIAKRHSPVDFEDADAPF